MQYFNILALVFFCNICAIGNSQYNMAMTGIPNEMSSLLFTWNNTGFVDVLLNGVPLINNNNNNNSIEQTLVKINSYYNPKISRTKQKANPAKPSGVQKKTFKRTSNAAAKTPAPQKQTVKEVTANAGVKTPVVKQAIIPSNIPDYFYDIAQPITEALLGDILNSINDESIDSFVVEQQLNNIVLNLLLQENFVFENDEQLNIFIKESAEKIASIILQDIDTGIPSWLTNIYTDAEPDIIIYSYYNPSQR